MADDRATPPLDLLRGLRTVFDTDAKAYRVKERSAPIWEQRAAGAKALANETVVRKIDATLRDWG